VKAEPIRYRLDDVVIDIGSRQVTRDGVDLGITGLSFELLFALGRASPNLLSMNDLMRRVWPNQVVGPETLTQRVKILRRQLGDDSDQPRYIESRRGHGYRLLSAMTALPEQRAAASKDPEAEALYLQALAIMRGTHDSRDESLVFLDRALERDPQFGAALAHRALLHAGSVALSGAPPTLLKAAERDATQALARYDGLADAHLALAMIRASRHRWNEADAHHRTAMLLDSANIGVRNMYVLNVLRPTGQLRRARAELVASYQSAPDDGFTAHELALTHVLLGDDAAAARFVSLSQSLTGLPTPQWDLMFVKARIAARTGKYADAAECAANALPPILKQAGAAEIARTIYSALADPQQSARAIESVLAFAPALLQNGVDGRSRAFFLTAIAMLDASDTAFDLAFAWLREPDESCVVMDWSDLWLPELATFRKHARFQQLASQLGLIDYWQQSVPPGEHPTEWQAQPAP
jgi:DNA-binding winged helix-turn-helix (wHTH) protein